MTAPLLRRLLVGLCTVLAVSCLALPGSACPFCSMQGKTLSDDVNQASMVLYGTLTNAQLTQGDFGQGTTDLTIDAVVKKNDFLGDKKKITLPRYVPTDKDATVKFLVFIDIFKGKLDPFRGVPVKNDDIVKYLTGALGVQGKDPGTRLRFFFDWLDNADIEISNDAYKEFGNANYEDYKEIAKKLPADKIAKWLEDPNTPSFRYGLYASMLGHCGLPEHADLLRKLLDDPQKRSGSGLDGMLAGYVMLKPAEGWTYLTGILQDQGKDFLLRYASLRAVRFMWDSRPDLATRENMVKAVSLLLSQSDIADLAIEDLRKWKRWEALDQVLGLYGKPGNDVPIVKRAILRFALSCPEQPKAVAFVQQQRKKDAEWVKDVEELLKLENGVK